MLVSVDLINDMLSKLPPLVRPRIPELEVGNERSVADMQKFLNETEAIIAGMDRTFGMDQHSLDHNIIPPSILGKFLSEDVGEFAELVPVNENRLAPKRRPVELYKINRILRENREAYELAETELDILHNPIHLINLLERRLKASIGERDRSFVIFNNLGAEKQAAMKIYDKMQSLGILSETTLKKWITWYVDNFVNKKHITSGKSGLESLV